MQILCCIWGLRDLWGDGRSPVTGPQWQWEDDCIDLSGLCWSFDDRDVEESSREQINSLWCGAI